MKQAIAQGGRVIIQEIPAPALQPGTILVRSGFSFISTGTETAGVKSTYIPPLSKRLLTDPIGKIKRGFKLLIKMGLKDTLNIATGASVSFTPGYSLAGIVADVAPDVKSFVIGDRVACAGAGIAMHAEFAVVPKNLTVKIPDGCSLRDASSVTLGAIAMQGVRQAEPQLGNIIAVTGLGLLGQLTVQMLKAAGCKVIGIDLDSKRLEMAKDLGAELVVSADSPGLTGDIMRFTGGHGVDATILTAATTSDVPVQQAMDITRKKGKVVVVGAVGLNLQRSPFYEKEIDFRISCSYGPGRYDPAYEQAGIDYPYGYVRWTENRNMALYLDLVAEGKINLEPIIQRVHPIEEVTAAFDSLQQAAEKPLGVVLDYHLDETKPQSAQEIERKIVLREGIKEKKIQVGVIGAGGFTRSVHFPNMKKLSDKVHVKAVANIHGPSSKEAASQIEADYATTDYHDLLKDPDIDVILIGTRHNLHGQQVIESLEAGKAVFVEKPLALTEEEVGKIISLARAKQLPLLTGFNRRFSPAVQRIKEVMKPVNPPVVMYRVNAGYISPTHWTQTAEGGGRLVGEGCHMVDVLRFIAGSPVEEFYISSIRPSNEYALPNDNTILNISYKNGAIGVITYTAMGGQGLPKEYLEVHWDNKSAVVDDYRDLKFYGIDVQGWSSPEVDKGHLRELELFFEHVRGNAPAPISLEEMEEVSLLSIQANEAVFRGMPVETP